MKSALVLLRTPFQASIAPRVLAAEGVRNYLLVYFTQNDAPEDRHYFEHLAREAKGSLYCYARMRRFDVLGQLSSCWKARSWFKDQRQDLMVLASIDNYVISAIACRQTDSELVTMDDGTGNFSLSSSYHCTKSNWREKFYRCLIGACETDELKSRVARHYTFHPAFKNIVPPEKIRLLNAPDSFVEGSRSAPVAFFIGGPFEQIWTVKQISRVVDRAKSARIDYYVRHPRESCPLDIGAPFLDKKGLIAEDAITAAGAGRPIHLIGGFSSVFFNLGSRATRRTVLLPFDGANNDDQAALARCVGCDVEFV